MLSGVSMLIMNSKWKSSRNEDIRLKLWEVEKMESIINTCTDLIEKQKAFAVVTIIANHGSTPRTAGSKMVVLADKTIFGTIGGGLIESIVIEESIQLIGKQTCLIKEYALDQDMKEGLDMICGGKLSILIETYPATLSEEDSALEELFYALDDLEKKNRAGLLVSKIEGFSRSEFTTLKAVVMRDGTITGHDIVQAPLLKLILGNKFKGTDPVLHNEGLEEFIIEPVVPNECIYIFGAGHVGLQLEKAAHLADFNTIVIDDREEFANRERFVNALEVHAVNHFANAFDHLTIDQNSYLVILTRGHLHDQVVLEAALKTQPAYIGMIGSRTKRNRIYKNLLAKGVSQAQIDSVYSPIGIDIKAQTPGEIAISIMGEIIEKKYTKDPLEKHKK